MKRPFANGYNARFPEVTPELFALKDSSRTLRSGKVTFADEEALALLGERLEHVRHPDKSGWDRVKQNSSRTVYRGQIDGREIYLKQFHSRTLIHRLGRMLGASDARREMTFSRYLAAHGVAAAAALAYECANGAEWLASLGVAPTERATEWCERQLTLGAAGRRALQQAIIAAAEAIGRMHAVGVIHCDLHAGNLLVRTDAPQPQIVLMDLHRMKRRRRLSRRQRVANLAQLFHDRFEWTTRSERLRFLKHYLAASGADGTLRGWQLLIEDFAWRHRRKLYAQRERRILANNQYFHRIRLDRSWRGHVVLASKRQMAGSQAATCVFRLEDWQRALAQPERLLINGQVSAVIKDSGSGQVVRSKLTVGNRTLDVYIKRPRRKRVWKVLIDCFRPARPTRAFRLGHALLTRQIPTALPLVALERRIGPLLLDSILITEAVEAPSLQVFLNQWLTDAHGGTPLGDGQRRELEREVLWQMGRLLQRLHDNNYHHRDLKGANMLVRWSPGATPEIVLVDLDGLARVRRLTEKQRFHGLMRLNVSLLRCPCVNHAGQLRMLLGYLRRPGSGRIHFKPYWRVLEAWSASKLQQQIRARRKKQKAVRG